LKPLTETRMETGAQTALIRTATRRTLQRILVAVPLWAVRLLLPADLEFVIDRIWLVTALDLLLVVVHAWAPRPLRRVQSEDMFSRRHWTFHLETPLAIAGLLLCLDFWKAIGR